jgi:hypothetical protein
VGWTGSDLRGLAGNALCLGFVDEYELEEILLGELP